MVNRPKPRAVEPREIRKCALIFSQTVIATLLGASACQPIDGGAAELSWSIYDFAGNLTNNCSSSNIGQVALCWASVDETPSLATECREEAKRVFPCSENHGVTQFELPLGDTAFWIQAICQDGAPAFAETYQVPSPIVRNVRDGEVVTLNSLVIVASNNQAEVLNCAEAGCTCL